MSAQTEEQAEDGLLTQAQYEALLNGDKSAIDNDGVFADAESVDGHASDLIFDYLGFAIQADNNTDSRHNLETALQNLCDTLELNAEDIAFEFLSRV